jgi:hypothetical protein
MIITENIVVTFPSNAFEKTQSIEIYYNPAKNFGEGQITGMYYIKNLPSNIKQPISVEITLPGSATEDIEAIIEENVFVPSLNKEHSVYRTIDSELNSGTLYVEIPATEDNQKSAQTSESTAGDDTFNIGVAANKVYKYHLSDQGHFRITYEQAYEKGIDDLAKYLEEAYTKIHSSPLDFSYANRTSWPVSVCVRKMEETAFGYYSGSMLGDNYGSLEFNALKLSDKKEMRITVGHEFFHLVQALYDRRNRYSKAKLAAPQLWLDEATAVWIEEKFSSDTKYTSTIIRGGHQMAPFNGMDTGAKENAAHYGYGMSALIKYLAGKQGDGIIVKMYEAISKNNSATNAISISSTESVSLWYSVFLEQYVLGKLYNDLKIDGLVGNKSDGFICSTNKDTIKQFTKTYPDMSGKLFTVSVATGAIDDKSVLKVVSNTNNTDLSIFKYNTGSIEFLARGTGSVSLENLKKLVDEGYKFMLLVTNTYSNASYNGSRDITTTIQITKNSDGVLNYCKSLKYLEVWWDIDVKWSDGTTSCIQPWDGCHGFGFDNEGYLINEERKVFPISWSGGTFSFTGYDTYCSEYIIGGGCAGEGKNTFKINGSMKDDGTITNLTASWDSQNDNWSVVLENITPPRVEQDLIDGGTILVYGYVEYGINATWMYPNSTTKLKDLKFSDSSDNNPVIFYYDTFKMTLKFTNDL